MSKFEKAKTFELPKRVQLAFGCTDWQSLTKNLLYINVPNFLHCRTP